MCDCDRVGVGLAIPDVFGVCDSREVDEVERNKLREGGGRRISGAGAGGGRTHVLMAECACEGLRVSNEVKEVTHVMTRCRSKSTLLPTT